MFRLEYVCLLASLSCASTRDTLVCSRWYSITPRDGGLMATYVIMCTTGEYLRHVLHYVTAGDMSVSRLCYNRKYLSAIFVEVEVCLQHLVHCVTTEIKVHLQHMLHCITTEDISLQRLLLCVTTEDKSLSAAYATLYNNRRYKSSASASLCHNRR